MVRADLIDGDGFEALARRLGLIYVETHDLAQRMADIRHMGRVSVLSHNSDGGIRPPGVAVREHDFVWQGIPDNIDHWFAQNVDVSDDRLTPIPIGLERDRWHPEMRKKEILLSMPRGEKSGLLYLNANTRIVVQREALYQRFGDLPWVTAERGRNGIDFEHYARQISAHKFVLCPDGNGLDTHRTWETLYLGSFPVVARHRFTEEFSNQLPLLVVDDWEEVTEDRLNNVYAEFMGRDWNWEILTMNYWENLIRSRL